ncbi:mechanosensitive ion channel domain-containing protein [Novipirellula artificiosorum]|uniref:Putative MscS family protein.1 n=1 Tax=Novipirellula artificiosorum TaxID=2528016 RepID=A0A5C6D5F6_9BACT|nr:mechanosensitive ion channel domain-containing protein [Novipirellula artificiosorum]TWU32038.1 putative MscS family protein.1 precursor [Novipirellula artificiosorum]
MDPLLPYGRIGPHAVLLLAACVLGLPGPVAWSQGTAPTTSGDAETAATEIPDDQSGTTTAPPILLEEVPNRAEATTAELATLLPRDSSHRTLERVGGETDLVLKEVETQLAKTRKMLTGRPNVRTLQRSSAELTEMLDHLRSLEEELDGQLDGFGDSFERIDKIAAVWTMTDELAKTKEDADATMLTRIAAVLGEIAQMRSSVVERRNELLSVRDKLVNPSVALAESIEQLQATVEARLAGIFRAEHPPLWSPRIRESLQMEWQTIGPQLLRKRFEERGQVSRKPTHSIGFQIVLFLAIGLTLRWLRQRTRARAEVDNRLRGAQLVFEHPWAMAVLITAFLTIPLDPLAPRSAGLVAAAFIAVATLRIVQRYLPDPLILFTWGLAILYILDRSRDLLDTTPTLSRLVFFAEMFGGLGLLIYLLRPSRIVKLPEERRGHPFFRPLYVAMSLAAGVLTIAILSDLFGWSDLAVLLGDGVLRSGYLGLVVFVLLKVAQGLAMFALVLRPLELVRAISNHRQRVQHWLERGLSVLAAGFWAALVCGQLGLLTPAIEVAKQVLGASVEIGALSVSLSDVVVFAFTVWFSFLLARWVQVLLQEDVFSRVRTSRGVPYAVSNLARYSVICLGFLVGLSAAGVEITKLAVVAGGLGVGIGFGLQNVVNNFVSGLILLFERPIDVGDTIELSDTSGTMKRIGIRASVIRTFDGAEVIVPNGMLISDKVTNWTLSDRRRRIDLNVGVEYGTPAQRVIDLLIDVAKANPKVIGDPEPVAFFENFGDSSLDFKLRAWFDADHATNTHTIHSEIAVAVQQALEDAHIGVPFPQRDLRLISMPPNAESDPNAATDLGAVKPPSDPRDGP